MCGLVGVAGAMGLKEEGAFKTLLKLDVLRGEDSTGIAALSTFGGVTVCKQAVNSIEFLAGKKPNAAFYGVNRILLGHNRAATKGKVVDENAHPFVYGDIIGAHNGTLNAWAGLLDGKTFDVDSKAIFNHMSEEGVTDLWKKLNGAAALTWIHKTRKTINFLRNSKRELHYTHSKDGKTLFWASEPWMLYVALGRAGLEHGEIFEFKTNTHYEFSPEKGLELKVRELEPYTFVYIPPVTSGIATTANRGSLPSTKVLEKDFVTFEVNVVRDFIVSGNIKRCNIIGTSTTGKAVRIWNVDFEDYAELLHRMTTESIKFKGRAFTGNNIYAINLDIDTVYADEEFPMCACRDCKDVIPEIDAHQQKDGKFLCDMCMLDLMYNSGVAV